MYIYKITQAFYKIMNIYSLLFNIKYNKINLSLIILRDNLLFAAVFFDYGSLGGLLEAYVQKLDYWLSHIFDISQGALDSPE